MLTRQFFSFGHMRDDDLSRFTGIHLQERVLHADLVLHEEERVCHLAYVVIEGTCADKERMCANDFRSFGSQVRDLHGVLERTRGFLRQGVQELGVDIREFNQSKRRDETEHFLKGEDESVATDGEQTGDEEIEIRPRFDSVPRTGLGNDERGVHECLDPEVPSCCTEQLCPAGHVVQDGNSSKADTQFDEEELHRHRNDNRGDEDRDEMDDYRCTGVDEDTRKDRNPHKRHEVNRQSEMQAETRQTDDEEHLQAEEQDFRERSEVLRPEDYKIEHKKGKEKKYQ